MNSYKNNLIIFLNRIELDGKSYIKLYFRPNEKILQRIKNNDWIRYSVQLNSYYVIDSEKNIGLVKELLSDLADVSTKHLDWKPNPQPRIKGTNIGLDYYDKPALQKKKK